MGGRKAVKVKVTAKAKKSANAQAAEMLGRKMRNGGGAGNIDSGSEEDMFAASPSPVKKIANREFKEMGSQVSPAFVAAGEEERQVGSRWREEEGGLGHNPNPCHGGGEEQG